MRLRASWSSSTPGAAKIPFVSSLPGVQRVRNDASMKDNRMQDEYDFSGGKRGPVDQSAAGKTRITIRLDEDVIAWFRTQAEQAGAGNYQTAINQALRAHIERQSLEELLR